MTEICTDKPYTDNQSPFSAKAGIYGKKQSPFAKKQGIFSNEEDKLECFKNLLPHLLQENGQAILLENYGYILL